jgi:hypothetical protein
VTSLLCEECRKKERRSRSRFCSIDCTKSHFRKSRSTVLSKKQVTEAIKNTQTMSEAAIFCGVNLRTFKKYAVEYNLYNPAPSGPKKEFSLQEIFDGKYPHIVGARLLKRLVQEGLKKYACEKCGIEKWNGEKISLELNHINGVHSDQTYENLEILCPNCHSQTPTYRSKSITFRRASRTVASSLENCR